VPKSDAATHDNPDEPTVILHTITDLASLPPWAPRRDVVQFFHEHMKPYHDTVEDVDRAVAYGLEPNAGQGGFLVLAEQDESLVGALLMLNTGMSGYVPPWILLFVGVDEKLRGRGIGGQIIEEALSHCDGDVKLHVEYDNPAKRLYERVGFTTKYAEMRLSR